MGDLDLEEAPAVHFNFPLLSFFLYIAFKSGFLLPVSLFLRNRGGLVIVGVWCQYIQYTRQLARVDELASTIVQCVQRTASSLRKLSGGRTCGH